MTEASLVRVELPLRFLWAAVVTPAVVLAVSVMVLAATQTGNGSATVTITDPAATAQHEVLANAVAEIREGQREDERDRKLSLAILAMRPEMRDALLPDLIADIRSGPVRDKVDRAYRRFTTSPAPGRPTGVR